MTKRKTNQKRLSVQDIAEVLIERIDQLETIEGKATRTIEHTLFRIEQQQNKKIQIDTEKYVLISNNFLQLLQKKHEEHLQDFNDLFNAVAEEQNDINAETQKLNSKLYEIQNEVKKLSKVGFGRLPNYLVAVLVGVLGVIVLVLLVQLKTQ